MTKETRTQILHLRARGHTWDEISKLVGIPRSTCSNVGSDPTGAKLKQRKERYRRPCPKCGTLMSGTQGAHSRNAPKLCRTCAYQSQRDATVWTPEVIIEAIKLYADRYGHPPSARDWSPSLARIHFRDDIADRFYEDGLWPITNSVIQRFGTWNAAIAAAGFTPLKPGHKYSDGKYPDQSS